MSLDALTLCLLAVCCVVLAMVKAAEWSRVVLTLMALAVAATLVACGDLASRTSVSEVAKWAASPPRRQDLAALLLGEALLFGSQAVRLAQGDAREGVATPVGIAWRLLGWLPPPSALLALYFSEVAVMLSIDGQDFEVLSWLCGGVFGAVFAAGAVGVRAALPDPAQRSLMRVALHGAQAAAGLWLARPAFMTRSDPVPLWGDRLAIVAAAVAALVLAGWLWQRRHGPSA